MNVQDKLAKLMELRDWSAAQVSRKTGISEPQLSRFLDGKRLPKKTAILALAYTFNVRAEWLEDDKFEWHDMEEVVESGFGLSHRSGLLRMTKERKEQLKLDYMRLLVEARAFIESQEGGDQESPAPPPSPRTDLTDQKPPPRRGRPAARGGATRPRRREGG